MSTDRELLELAAKAAGLAIEPRTSNPNAWVRKKTGEWWRPLDDGNDALWLAVNLGLAINIDIVEGTTHAHADQCWKAVPEKHGTDPYAATRRAIVRAAAEIGKAMP